MSVARFLSYLKAVYRGGRLEDELSQELQFHLQSEIRKNIAAGMSPEEARYATLRRFGGVDQVKEQCRDIQGPRWTEEFWQDIKYGSRMLVKNPVFTTVAVLTLGLGIGANTSIFSVANAILLRPLSLPDPDRLVVISEVELRQGGRRSPTMGSYQEWKRHSRSFEGIVRASLGGDPATLSGIGHAERIELDYASPSFFSLLGVKAFRGRTFLPDDAPGGEGIAVVISHDLWHRTFAASEEVIGQTVGIDGHKKTIVGVLPPGFSVFPWKMTVDAWLAFNFDRLEPNMRWMDVVGRLKPGVSFGQAQTELSAIALQTQQKQPSEGELWRIQIETLHEANVGNTKGLFFLLLGAVGFVLLVACANVANLTLARGAALRKEMTIRASLGASRRRLLFQAFTESMLLALLGGMLGLFLAIWGQKIVLLLNPVRLSLTLALDGRAFVFTLVTSLLTAFLFGIVPAIQTSKPNVSEFLKEAGTRAGGGRRQRGRAMLLVSEVALSLVLLIGAGLMINSFLRLQRVSLGFNPKNLLTADIVLNGTKYWHNLPDIKKRVTPQGALFFQQVLERVQALPGVTSAGLAHLAPPRYVQTRSFHMIAEATPPPQQEPRAGYNEVSSGYFRALEMPLRQGRYLTEQDVETTPWVVVINEALARRFFPNENPIGKQLQLRILGGSSGVNVAEDRPREIVGVVGNIRQWGFEADPGPMMYASYRQHASDYPGGFYLGHLWKDLIVRASSDPTRLAPALQKIVAEVDPDQAVFDIQTMDESLSESLAGRRFLMRLFGVFGGLALVLAAVGIYGIVSYLVTERTREFGVRIALGAQRMDVVKLVVRGVLKTTAVGLLIGVAGSLALTRLIAQFLYGVKATDPMTYSLVSLLLIVVAVAASYIPARRATRVDPMVALRYE